MKKIVKILGGIVLLSVGVAAGFFGERLRPKQDPMEQLNGVWVTKIDISEEVCTKAELWLEDVEGITVTSEELRQVMGTLEVELLEEYVLDENGYAVCTKRISEESYERCKDKAYEGMTLAFEQVIARRLYASDLIDEQILQDILSIRLASDVQGTGTSAGSEGTEGNTGTGTNAGTSGNPYYTDNEASLMVKSVFAETFGMEMEDYLREYGPEIMPDLEQLNAEYAMSERKQVSE